jgi:hypothetical protein
LEVDTFPYVERCIIVVEIEKVALTGAPSVDEQLLITVLLYASVEILSANLQDAAPMHL